MSDLCKCGHAEDHHFTPRLGGRCFRHECECVAFEAPNADRDDLAAILAKHQQSRSAWKAMVWHVICTCDDYIPVRPGAKDEDVHRAHVAQMVLESDWLRDVKAGVRADVEAVHRMGRTEYRADRVDAEDTDNTTDRT